ncbi:MAG: hypothetical protein IAG10_24745 [Planctomycetaceae bacterium]|nr:hypothetical protein [Planctomycetaceae bacterium]
MMFRYLEPDAQALAQHCDIWELSFYSVYVPIKNTDLKITELARLHEQHADVVLNEHIMTTYVGAKLVNSLARLATSTKSATGFAEEARAYFNGRFKIVLAASGYDPASLQDIPASWTCVDIFRAMADILDGVYREVLLYLRRLAFSRDALSYSGPLFGYLDFLVPFIHDLKQMSFMPKGPIFLLFDDADNLNETQTRILNSWVSSRTSGDISLKISTQLAYKTFRTITGQTIDSPHDFSEVNLSTIYTSSNDRYRERIAEIVTKRLRNHGLSISPEQFFPPDEEQEEKIRARAQALREQWAMGEGRGHRASDDAIRYARPDYIRSLRGASKSGHTYSYAGFGQLVHVSSGIVRYFLQAAAQMYAEQQARLPNDAAIEAIPHHIQNTVVREQADRFLFTEFERIELDQDASKLKPVSKLRNLILALGGLFYETLVSDRSERRVFSIAFSDAPDAEIRGVFALGIQYGYFHESAIGNKEGTGRTKLYILSRRLAPHFNLDPTSFAGYRFVTSNVIRDAMTRPKTFLGRVRNGAINADTLETYQLSLLPEEEQ